MCTLFVTHIFNLQHEGKFENKFNPENSVPFDKFRRRCACSFTLQFLCRNITSNIASSYIVFLLSVLILFICIYMIGQGRNCFYSQSCWGSSSSARLEPVIFWFEVKCFIHYCTRVCLFVVSTYLLSSYFQFKVGNCAYKHVSCKKLGFR